MSQSLPHPTLSGKYVRLEPLETHHIDALTKSASGDRSSYAYATVPDDPGGSAAQIVGTRLEMAAAGTWLPYVQIRVTDGLIVGATNLIVLDRWNGLTQPPTSAEIGGTWLSADAQRTPINTEAKYLLLHHAFEQWGVARVQIKTDERNDRSRAAIARLGASFEGILRNFQAGQGDLGYGTPRNTAMYSITDAEWPHVKSRLEQKLG
jgi:N-acetyltransferase